MINYNDGNWHGWNGGNCPVHPETVVELRLKGVGAVYDEEEHKADGTVTLRVVKEYKGPKVIWVNEYGDGHICTHSTYENAKRYAGPDVIRVAVRYVEQPE